MSQFLNFEHLLYMFFSRYNVANLEIRVGTNLADTNRGQLLEVEKIVVHENYEQQSDYDYDIAVVKVTKPLTFGKKINKISVSETGLTINKSTVFGWGQPNIVSAFITFSVNAKEICL